MSGLQKNSPKNIVLHDDSSFAGITIPLRGIFPSAVSSGYTDVYVNARSLTGRCVFGNFTLSTTIPLLPLRFEDTVLRWLVYIFLLNGLFPILANGQAVHHTITGRITDAETGYPIEGVHVIIGASLIGTVSNSEGMYTLQYVPQGRHSLLASSIGYIQESKPLSLYDSLAITRDFALAPAVYEMTEITVSAKQDRRWKKRFARFDRLFMGETPFAREATILNPSTLDFSSNWTGRFAAYAHEPLVIENKALGYRLTYFLKDFEIKGATLRYDGDPLFEELPFIDPAQASIWDANRAQAFNGSFRHFLLALLHDRIEEEGFEIYRLPSIEDIYRNDRRFRVSPEGIQDPGEQTGETMLKFHGVIEIVYTKEMEDPEYLLWQQAATNRRPTHQRSWIRLSKGPTPFDENGEVIDPYGVVVYGYFAYERIASMLPKEYRPATLQMP